MSGSRRYGKGQHKNGGKPLERDSEIQRPFYQGFDTFFSLIPASQIESSDRGPKGTNPSQDHFRKGQLKQPSSRQNTWQPDDPRKAKGNDKESQRETVWYIKILIHIVYLLILRFEELVRLLF